MVGSGHRDDLLPRRTRALGRSRLLALWTVGALLASLVAVVSGTVQVASASTAAFTTVNETFDGTGHCQNGNPNNNCNIYDGKDFVWLNGGPHPLDEGTYFFAVLAPGGQPNAQDGSAKNLSDDFDAYTNRTFTVDGSGTLTYSGTHKFDSNEIRLSPYADTPNPGGVYIMAICSLANGYPPGAHDCDYDAFKVTPTNNPPAKVNSVFTGTKYNDTDYNGAFTPGEAGLPNWVIHITTGGRGGTEVANSPVTTDADGNWTFTTPDATVGTPPTTYTICEEQQTHWSQTGPVEPPDVTTANGTSIGGAAATLNASATPPAGNCYDVSVPTGGPSSLGSLDFFNVHNVSTSFSGTKWLDANGNGLVDGVDVGLPNWVIHVTTGGVGGTDVAGSPVTTASNGTWSLALAEHTPTAGTTAYTVCEEVQTGWAETAPTPACYAVNAPNDATTSNANLDFHNQPRGSISGLKYYDSNQNGRYDSGEALIGLWKITITKPDNTVVSTTTANVTGAFSFGNLPPGTYTVREVQATNGWSETGNTTDQSTTSGGATESLASFTYTVTLSSTSPSSDANADFGNVCSVRPGGLTLGFWSNKNGQNLENAADFTSLNNLNLRNANGTDKDFTGTLAQNKAALNTWLLSATATNMAYMLSAQLAALQLNVNHGVTNPAIVVDGTNTVAQEITYANSLLANPIVGGTFNGQNGSVTVASTALRAEQGRVKTIIDSINNNGGFVQPDPGTCPAPTFP